MSANEEPFVPLRAGERVDTDFGVGVVVGFERRTDWGMLGQKPRDRMLVLVKLDDGRRVTCFRENVEREPP